MTLPPPPPRVKVCCISSLEEARLAIGHGASALGLVSQMHSGPGAIADELIAEIAARCRTSSSSRSSMWSGRPRSMRP